MSRDNEVWPPPPSREAETPPVVPKQNSLLAILSLTFSGAGIALLSLIFVRAIAVLYQPLLHHFGPNLSRSSMALSLVGFVTGVITRHTVAGRISIVLSAIVLGLAGLAIFVNLQARGIL